MGRPLNLRLFILVVGILAAGCNAPIESISGGTGTEGAACSATGTCALGLVCVQGTCVVSGTSPPDTSDSDDTGAVEETTGPAENQPPHIQITNPEDGAVFPAGEVITLAATLSDDRDAAVDLTARWRSNIEGNLGISLVDTSGATTLNADDLTPGMHELTVLASDSSGLEGSASMTLVINAPPSAPSVELSPAEPVTGDDLKASVSEVPTDLNRASDEFTYSWEWYADGVLQEDLNGPIVDSQYTARGEEWEIRIAAYDGYAFGPAGAASVTIGNTLPSCPAAQISPVSGDTTTFYTCTCPDRVDPDDDEAVDGCKFFNGTIEIQAVEAEAGECLLSPIKTYRGMILSCSYAAGDAGGEGGSGSSGEAVVVNAAPSQPEVALSPPSGTAQDLFTCGLVGIAYDPDNDPLTYGTTWYVNDQMVEGVSSLSVVPMTLTTGPLQVAAKRGDTIRCDVNADDGYDLSGTGSSQALTLENALPTAAGITIGPGQVFEGDTITCTVDSPQDADADEVTWSYAWTVNELTVIGADTPELDSTYFDRDDTVQCMATPHDGTDAGPTLSSGSLTVLNTPPTLDIASLTPSEGPRSQLFTCTGGGLVDQDLGDAPELIFTWYRSLADGTATVLEGETSGTLTAADLAPGDELTCRATPTDGTSEGVSQLSAPAVILNIPPDVPQPTLNPDAGKVTDSFWCVVGAAEDGEGDGLAFQYMWMVNDHINDTAITATLTGLDLVSDGAGTPARAGDSISCLARASDSWDTSEWGESPKLTLTNTPPQGGAAFVTPEEPREGDVVTCKVVDVLDCDNDEVTTEISWFVDQVPVEGEADGTLTGAAFDKDQSISCTAIPHDGTDPGETLVSTNVMAVNTAATLASASISPTESPRSGTFTCDWSGWADPDDGDQQVPMYTWHLLRDGVESLLPGATNETRSADDLLPGDQPFCRVKTWDGETIGEPVGSDHALVTNITPTLSAVTLGPEGASGLDTLTCAAEGFHDEDGDAPVLSFRWIVDGAVVEGATEGSLAGQFHDGHTVECEVAPGDAYGAGEAVTSNSLAITNALPVASSVSLAPNDGLPCEVYTCETGEILEPDPGDEVTLTFSWTVNGETTDEAGSTFESGDLTPGDLLACQATVTDGTLDDTDTPLAGPTTSSEPVEIVNTAPTTESCELSPPVAAAGDTLTCVATGFADSECDPEEAYRFTWRVDDEVVPDETQMTFDTDDFPEGALVSCEAAPFDGWVEGASATSEALVLLDPAPTPPVVVVQAPDGPEGDLVCSVVMPATDDDALNFVWTWWVGSGPEAVGAYKRPAAFYNPCERIYCRLTVTDGTHEVSSEPGSYQVPIGPPCVDNNPCTDNECGELGGCMVTMNEAPCEDGDHCTLNDACFEGSCTSGGFCETSSPCMLAQCDAEEGCLFTPEADCCGNGDLEGDESCDDGNIEDGDGCSSSCEFDPPGGMVVVPGGPFWMGCNDAQLDVLGGCAGASPAALPQHEVTLPPYFIDEHEVTVSAYQGCVDAGACSEPDTPEVGAVWHEQCNWLHPARGEHPMNFVSWDQAHSFCAWRGDRLPTEAEWEKAATGGCELYPDGDCKASTSPWPWGSWDVDWATKEATVCDYAVADGACAEGPGCCNGITSEVGAHPAGASAYGAVDMAGNVSEWVSDWFDPGYYAVSPPINPMGPPSGVVHSYRGGSFLSAGVEHIATSARNGQAVIDDAAMGFRCVRSAGAP